MAGPGLQSPVGGRDVVIVPERGHVDIPESVWDAIKGTGALQRLLSRGVLSASVLPSRGMRLNGACYVGRAQLGNVVLELREKIDGALAALLGHATHEIFRIDPASAPASDLGELAALLVHQFAAAATAYASNGRNFRFTIERRVGSLVGGRLDITRSLRLRARGLRHLLAFDKNVVSYSTPVNRVVLAALREVDRLTRVVRIPHDDVARTRGLALLFADCRDAEILFGHRAALVEQAQILLKKSLPPAIADLVALAGVVLAHESFEYPSDSDDTVPRTWFLNLETLFETAVRSLLRDLVSAPYCVSRGSEHGERVFPGIKGEYGAHPDIVVAGGSIVSAVGDVKYKVRDGRAEASDVYQLLVHAAAFGCRCAFLVFPSDRFGVRRLGTAATGCDVRFFDIDVRNMRRDIERLVDELGYRHAPPCHVDSAIVAGSASAAARP